MRFAYFHDFHDLIGEQLTDDAGDTFVEVNDGSLWVACYDDTADELDTDELDTDGDWHVT